MKEGFIQAKDNEKRLMKVDRQILALPALNRPWNVLFWIGQNVPPADSGGLVKMLKNPEGCCFMKCPGSSLHLPGKLIWRELFLSWVRCSYCYVSGDEEVKSMADRLVWVTYVHQKQVFELGKSPSATACQTSPWYQTTCINLKHIIFFNK